MWETSVFPCVSILYRCSSLCCIDQKELFLHDGGENSCLAVVYCPILDIDCESTKTTNTAAWFYEVLQTPLCCWPFRSHILGNHWDFSYWIVNVVPLYFLCLTTYCWVLISLVHKAEPATYMSSYHKSQAHLIQRYFVNYMYICKCVKSEQRVFSGLF